MSITLKQQVIENLSNAIAIMKTYSHWEEEVRVLTEMIGAVKKSEGQL